MPNTIPEAARWRGEPSSKMIREIRHTYYYVAGNPWKGEKLGKSYGTMYRRTMNGLVPVRYSSDGLEIPTF